MTNTARPKPGMFAGDANLSAGSTPLPALDPRRCLPNVKAFIDARWQDAQRIAAMIGNDVTPTEVLATAGNESQWGNTKTGLAQYGNFFGLHGSGPAGTHLTEIGRHPTAMFPVDQGFPASGAAFAKLVTPGMTPGIGQRPFDFFSVLHDKYKYAADTPDYAAGMTQATPSLYGPYSLARACTRVR